MPEAPPHGAFRAVIVRLLRVRTLRCYVAGCRDPASPERPPAEAPALACARLLLLAVAVPSRLPVLVRAWLLPRRLPRHWS